MIIAIDGPSGAGKSSVSDEVAKALGFSHLDHGAMFRAVAYCALENGVDVNDEPKLGLIAERGKITFENEPGNPKYKAIFINGRDIGTVVFPDADLKIFLTASAEERAKRRVLQNEETGIGSTDFEEVLKDINRRDEEDSKREIAPLKKAEDAKEIDSTHMSKQEVIDKIISLAKEKQ